MWIARDKNCQLYLFLRKPLKIESKGYWDYGHLLGRLPAGLFSNVKWTDEEPFEVDIIPKNYD